MAVVLATSFLLPSRVMATAIPTCQIKFNLPSKQPVDANIVIYPDFVKDEGDDLYPGARFEVDDTSGKNFLLADKGCDFDSYGPTKWQDWNCTWDPKVNRQVGIHTIKMKIKGGSGETFYNECSAKFELVPSSASPLEKSMIGYTVKSGDSLWNVAKNQLKSVNLPVTNKNINYLKNLYVLENKLSLYKSGTYGLNTNRLINLYSEEEIVRKIGLIK